MAALQRETGILAAAETVPTGLITRGPPEGRKNSPWESQQAHWEGTGTPAASLGNLGQIRARSGFWQSWKEIVSNLV